jgi:hypothetical protein
MTCRFCPDAIPMATCSAHLPAGHHLWPAQRDPAAGVFARTVDGRSVSRSPQHHPLFSVRLETADAAWARKSVKSERQRVSSDRVGSRACRLGRLVDRAG